MRESLTRNFFLPLHERLRGRKTLKFYNELRDYDLRSSDYLLSLRLQKLRRLVSHCVESVPYYHDALKKIGISSVDELNFENFKELPPLDKDDIRKDITKFIAKNHHSRLIRYSTGGSTGEPLVFFTDKYKESQHKAHDWRCRSWFGVFPGDKQVDFWGSPIELNKLTGFVKWKDRTFLNHVVLPAFDLQEQLLHRHLQFLRRFQPKFLYGYPSVLALVARLLLENGKNLLDNRLKLVSCTSEMLYDHQREIIIEAFGCPVANEYGSRDGGLIAHDCPEGRLHILAEHVHLEVDHPDKTGIGDFLVTNLDGFGMPLLRYRIGDRGSIDSKLCSCGLPLPLLDELSGRTNDVLIGKDGVPVHSLAPVYALREYRSKLKQFKVIQRRDLSLEVQLVTIAKLEIRELSDIREKMVSIFGFDIPMKFVFLDYIPAEQSGKFRSVVCEVNDNQFVEQQRH